MESKTLRGMVLDFLRHVYPRPVMDLDIIGALYQDYRDTEIRDALAYLADKGYLERSEKEHPVRRYRKVITYRLTAAGVDLLEGDLDDRCVLVLEGN